MRVENVHRFEPDLVEALQRIEVRARIARERGPLGMRNSLQEIVKEAQKCLALDAGQPTGEPHEK